MRRVYGVPNGSTRVNSLSRITPDSAREDEPLVVCSGATNVLFSRTEIKRFFKSHPGPLTRGSGLRISMDCDPFINRLGSKYGKPWIWFVRLMLSVNETTLSSFPANCNVSNRHWIRSRDPELAFHKQDNRICRKSGKRWIYLPCFRDVRRCSVIRNVRSSARQTTLSDRHSNGAGVTYRSQTVAQRWLRQSQEHR